MARDTGVRARQREETRRRLFEAALAVFRRDGVAAARIEDIVARAGVSNGTFYFHFATKDDVLAELLRESSERVAARIVETGARSLPGVLRATCRAIAGEWRDDRRLFPAVGALALRGNAADSPVRNALVPHFRTAAARRVLTRRLPPELLAELFLLDVFAAAMAACPNPDLPLDQALITVATLFLDGARSR